jgi:hypothetical protein
MTGDFAARPGDRGDRGDRSGHDGSADRDGGHGAEAGADGETRSRYGVHQRRNGHLVVYDREIPDAWLSSDCPVPVVR